MTREQIAKRLLEMAAVQSVQSPFGWSHPNCVALQEAARVLMGEPEPKEDTRADGVLS